MDIHEKTQEDLAAALISHNQTLRHGNVMSEGYIQELRGQKANTAQAAERARRQAWRDADSATREIAELKKTISEFSRIVQNKQDTIEAFQAALAERDELLEQWVVSQMTFRSLFREYGQLENGVRVKEADKEITQAIVDKELAATKAQRAEERKKPKR